MPPLLDGDGKRVEHDVLAKTLWNEVDRVDDRRAPKHELESHVPDRLHVAIANEEHGQEQGERGREGKHPENERQDQEPRGAYVDIVDEGDNQHHAETEDEVCRRRRCHGYRYRCTRKGNLPEKALSRDEAWQPHHRGVCEEVEEDEPEEQQHRVVRDAGAGPNDLREDEVEDSEEQERSQETPEVAQHRPEVAQLELHPGERDRDIEEVPPGGQLALRRTWMHGHRYSAPEETWACAGRNPGSASRRTSVSCGRSTIPPEKRSPRTIMLTASSSQSAKR